VLGLDHFELEVGCQSWWNDGSSPVSWFEGSRRLALENLPSLLGNGITFVNVYIAVLVPSFPHTRGRAKLLALGDVAAAI
jgi:hypothetical protein